MRLVQAASSVARLPVLALEQGLSLAAAAARLAGRAVDRGSGPVEFVEPEPPIAEAEARFEEAEPRFVETEPQVMVPEPPVVVPEPELVVPEPVHVSEDPVLVAESAESGAEDGAGAELRIDEPWEGYSSMTASEIRGRLVGADAATAAAVKLYEAAHKGRSTVLQAASAPPSG